MKQYHYIKIPRFDQFSQLINDKRIEIEYELQLPHSTEQVCDSGQPIYRDIYRSVIGTSAPQ